MSYDEEQQRKSRVVVETPHTRREVEQTYVSHTPEKKGISTGMVAAVALAAIAAITIIFLFLRNPSDDSSNTNVSVTTRPTPLAQPSVIMQPAAQPTPIIIEAPSTQPAPVIITQPAPITATTSIAPPATSAPAPPDDSVVQSNVSKKIQDDPALDATDIIATVVSGKATLTGTVDSPDLKRRAERMALSVKGVRTVDNQITVVANATTSLSTPLQ
jgi:hyperosmotically inducible protein